MPNKPMLVGAALITVVVLFFAINGIDNGKEISESPDEEQTTENPVVKEATGLTSYSVAQVAEHAAQEDCWTIVDDIVYDVTSYVQNHPGGPVILRICGTDGTSDFKNRGAPQDIADEIREENNLTPDTEFHSPTAREILESFEIGVIE